MSEELTYIPPFVVSAEAINLIAEISAQIERYCSCLLNDCMGHITPQCLRLPLNTSMGLEPEV